MSENWNVEGLRRMADDPIQYSGELSSLAYFLADAIESTTNSKMFCEAMGENDD